MMVGSSYSNSLKTSICLPAECPSLWFPLEAIPGTASIPKTTTSNPSIPTGAEMHTDRQPRFFLILLALVSNLLSAFLGIKTSIVFPNLF